MRENFIGIPVPVCNEKQVRENYKRLTEKLIEKELTITTMESATGGQIASLITDTEGASAVLRGAFVTYSNEAKVIQGVPLETILKYSVYSEETTKSMAMACKATYGADIGVGVTGTLGNIDPENKSSSKLGQVFFTIILKDEIKSFSREIPAQPTRLLYKLFVADMVCMELEKMLDN